MALCGASVGCKGFEAGFEMAVVRRVDLVTDVEALSKARGVSNTVLILGLEDKTAVDVEKVCGFDVAVGSEWLTDSELAFVQEYMLEMECVLQVPRAPETTGVLQVVWPLGTARVLEMARVLVVANALEMA
jgi:hypothetical protein